MLHRNILSLFSLLIFTSVLSGCSKWLSVDPPATQSLSSDIFSDVSTANSAVAGMYSYMYQLNNSQSTFGGYHLSLHTGLSADEMFVPGSPSDPFYTNKLTKDNTDIEQIWSSAYSAIYSANAIIEGIGQSASIPDPQKSQYLGEALFIRSFAHFWLVNLFGNIPLILYTDVNLTKSIGRTSIDSIYTQIISDLLQAQSLLPEDYSPYNFERVRANKWVATAFLARIFLYRSQWANAESQASSVINETNLFALEPDPGNVFIKNSQEAIWQFLSLGGLGYTTVGNWLIGSTTSVPGFAMTGSLISAFEPGDRRFTSWVNIKILNQDTFYIPYKYRNSSGNIINDGEYDMVLRLAEQYLIRAEARVQQGDLPGATEDLNIIRNRAGLGPTAATTRDELLSAISQERKVELFSEWGHRWLDLKRTNTIDQILMDEKVGWTPDAALFPVPIIEIGNNPKLSQNPGY